MKLYNLEKSELFWEKALDTKMLLAWSDTCMVLVFRGTASMANALADLQVYLNVLCYSFPTLTSSSCPAYQWAICCTIPAGAC